MEPLEDPGGPSARVQDLNRALRSLRDPDSTLAQEVFARTEEPLQDSLLWIFQLLGTRVVPALGELEPQRLSEAQEEFLLDLLARSEPGRVVQSLEALLQGEVPPETCAMALLVYGANGEARHVTRMLEIAAPSGDAAPPARTMDALRRSLERLLRREPKAYEEIQRTWSHGSREVVDVLVRAVGDAGDPRGLGFLGDVLLSRPDLARLALAQVRSLGPSSSVEQDRLLAHEVRKYLSSTDALDQQSACLALGELGDAAALGELIDLLEEESTAVREAAAWALSRISGLSYPPKAEPWRRWYQKEEAWREGRFHYLQKHLEHDDSGRVSKAVAELLQHPIYRHEIAEALVGLCAHRRSKLRALACRSLESLGSPLGVPQLRLSLEDRDAEVARAAWTALRAITGVGMDAKPL